MSGMFASIICFFLNWNDSGWFIARREFKHQAKWHWFPRGNSAAHRARGCWLSILLLCVLGGGASAQTAARYAITGSGAPAGSCVVSGAGYAQIYINRANGDWYTCSGALGTTSGTWVLSGNHLAGTVTSVSVVTANGFSGSVATATTTPAITINNPTALVATISTQSPFYKSAASDPADAGVVRLGNAELIEWEANPTGTDLTLGMDTNNVLSSSVPINATTGFRIGNAAASGNYLRGNGFNFISATIQAGDLPTGIDATKIGNGDVTNTILSFLNTVSSNVQTQINGKQATITFGTGVQTALGVNVGTAGAFVVNGGALGSPSSAGTIPAFTLGGTIAGGGNQLNNIIIGTTTPLAGSFTTLTTSSTGTFSNNQNATSTWTFQNTDNTNTSSRAQISLVGGAITVRHLIIAQDGYYFGTLSDSIVHFQQGGNQVLDLPAGHTGVAITGGLSVTGAAVNLPGLGTSSAATTGTMCWTTGTGLVNVDTTTTCLLSSAKYKKNDLPLTGGLNMILKLRPISYFLKDDPYHLGEQEGFFAEDVVKVDPRLVSLEADGSPHAVRYQQLTAQLTLAIQELNVKVERYHREKNTTRRRPVRRHARAN